MAEDNKALSEEEQKPETKNESVAEEKPVENVQEVPTQETNSKNGKIKQFVSWYKSHKKISIPASVLIVLLILFAIPFSRYGILGLFLKQDIAIHVKDSQTGKAISEASVSVAGKNATTGSDGDAHLSSVPVGNHKVVVTKKYYADSSSNALVPIRKSKASFEISLKATGRQVPVRVVNKVGGQPVENVLVKTIDTQARTDKEGKAIVVVGVDQTSQKVTLSGDGYNQNEAELKVTEQEDPANTFQVTPAGKIYFLSKKSGKVDVVKTNLDGSDRKTVLAGTGKEDTYDTVLLASRDWKYLLLKSKRDGGDSEKLFLIDTSNDSTKTIDEGNASFTLNGWTGHSFVYTVNRKGLQLWQDKATALKSYDADNKKINVLDETVGIGTGNYDYAKQTISNVYVLPTKVVYTKVWDQGGIYDPSNRKTQIVSVDPSGSNKASLKDFSTAPADRVTYIFAKLYEPEEIYFEVYSYNAQNQFVEYKDNKVQNSTITQDTFSKFYPTYLLSPSGKQTFWYEPRDGKNTLFVGDKDGENEKEVASLSEFIPYGWYTDDYLLVSKNSSELYILPKSGVKDLSQVLKVSDYHKPSADFTGYGGGYGGF